MVEMRALSDVGVKCGDKGYLNVCDRRDCLPCTQPQTQFAGPEMGIVGLRWENVLDETEFRLQRALVLEA